VRPRASPSTPIDGFIPSAILGLGKTLQKLSSKGYLTSGATVTGRIVTRGLDGFTEPAESNGWSVDGMAVKDTHGQVKLVTDVPASLEL
jgi:hypothetical protein